MINPILKNNIIDVLKAYDPLRVSIFGSYARGEEKSGSDLDILIKFKNRIGLLKLVQIEQELSDKLGVKIDLVTENALRNQRLKDMIEQDMITIYE